jgi:hypothetical protein
MPMTYFLVIYCCNLLLLLVTSKWDDEFSYSLSGTSHAILFQRLLTLLDSANTTASSSHTSKEFIANALKQMPLEEHEKVYYEIHGVTNAIEETHEFVNKALVELQEELIKNTLSSSHLFTDPTSIARLCPIFASGLL